MILNPHIYIKLKKNTVWAKCIETQRVAELISPQPFTTKRLLVGQFSIAEPIVQSLVRQVYSRSLIAPKVLVHPLEYIEEGLSEVEERCFCDLAAQVGARKAVIWIGAELSDGEVVEKLKVLPNKL